MNAKDRKEIVSLIGQIEEIKERLELYATAEQDKFDNLSEGLQQTERGQKYEETATALNDAVSDLENCIGNIETATEVGP